MSADPPRTLLLTNDDGVDAPGIGALFEATAGLGERVVVAPFGPYSGCSQTVTYHKPLTIATRSDGRHVVEGAPADCVRIARFVLAPQFDWVVSGINAGGNLGMDVLYSGTVAAAREGVLLGRPGIAVSQYIARGRQVDWVRSSRWAAGVIRMLLDREWMPGTFWNVNLPHPESDAPDPGVCECPLDPSPLPVSYRLENDGRVAHYVGDYQSRARLPGHDVDVCFAGRITLTRIPIVQGGDW